MKGKHFIVLTALVKKLPLHFKPTLLAVTLSFFFIFKECTVWNAQGVAKKTGGK